MKVISYIATSLLACFAITSCTVDDPFTPQSYDLQGKVEKGPFISGSTISIQPMNSKLQVTGTMYSTSINDDLGNFMLPTSEFAAPYVEFMANGYFFNEVKGELSAGPITLRALVDLQDNTTVNVNILTHLKYPRIKNLVASGMSFSEANRQAQTELLGAFGLSDLADNDVSSFSIIAGTDESAALLAISSLLLMDRSEAAFTEYLSKLSADFGNDGSFSDDVCRQIAADKHSLAKDLDDIRDNVISRYESLGIGVTVKDPVHFIDWNNDGIAGNEVLKEEHTVSLDCTEVEFPAEGGQVSIKFTSPIQLYLQPQVETDFYISSDENIGSEIFSASLYSGYDESFFSQQEISCETALDGTSLTISVAPLTALSANTRRISLYDYVGNVAATISLSQRGETVNIPVSEAPLLGPDGEQLVNAIAASLMEGLRPYSFIEQLYAWNKTTGMVEEYIYPAAHSVSAAWSNIFAANMRLLQLKALDEARLNVYGDYCNVLSALYYSNLVYGWGAVPYITDHSMYDHIFANGIAREAEENIFKDLKSKLEQAIVNLPEKKNEPLNGANGFFFASKDVARVLLANILMYQGRHAEAQPLLQKVVDNGFYTLDASTDFKPSTETETIGVDQSREVIFAFRYGDSAGTRANITITEPGVIPYITLSEVCLSLAECHHASGDSQTAERYIADILNAKNLSTAETDVLMKIKDLREQILIYGCTYFAFLKRTGLAKEVCGIDDYRLLLPIPIDELYSNAKMTQNPGY